MSPDTTWPLTIYYDASCPLCRAELHGLKARDHDDRLRLVDCSAPGFHDPHLAAAGISVDTAMARIQARDADGRWFDGVGVFERAYAGAGLAWVARLLGLRWLRPVLDRAYPVVARNRGWLSKLGLAPVLGWAMRRGRGDTACRIER
ncbi:MAG: thiol-disulfide oxidoreductase DCC family protein [Lysobacteraceae bacterium]